MTKWPKMPAFGICFDILSYHTFLSMLVIMCTRIVFAQCHLVSSITCNIGVAKALCIWCFLPLVSWNVVNIFHHSVTQRFVWVDTLPKYWAVCWHNHAGSFCTKAFDLCNRSHWHMDGRPKGSKTTEKLIIFVHHILLVLDPGTSGAQKAMYCTSKGTNAYKCQNANNDTGSDEVTTKCIHAIRWVLTFSLTSMFLEPETT